MTIIGGSIHPTAIVEDGAQIGAGTRIWHWAQVRTGAIVGAECILGKGCYIDSGVMIGSRVKIQNGVSIYHGVTIEDGVFVGPHVCFTNDKNPRAITPEGELKGASDWTVASTLIRYGAALGAASVIVCGLTVGRFAMVAAGAVVTRDVPDHGLVMGCPTRLVGYVCACGERLPGGPGEADMPDEPRGCAACGRAWALRGGQALP